MRFVSMYGVFPRGYGKTYDEVLAGILCCMLFPGIEIALTAQTKQNASDLLQSKYQEICKHYPLIKNEVIKTNFSKDEAKIYFVNGATYDILANAQSSKGQRRRRVTIEESALLNNALYEDALAPIVEVGRSTVGSLGIINPEELNQQINFFTTSGFKGSDEHIRNLIMLNNMRNLTGDLVLGSNWMLGCWYGRGSTKEQIFKKKKSMSSVAFAQNYGSRWVGATENSLVDINKFLQCRNLSEPEFEAEEGYEYVLGVDVARSQSTSNNRSSVSVVKIIRNKDNTIKELQLVNIFMISNAYTFDAQAVEVKKIQKAFNAKCVVIDANGLGVGLVDVLVKNNTDVRTGEIFDAWKTKNTDQTSENDYAEDLIYALTPQSAQTRITVNFTDVVDSGKLRMLVKKSDSDFSPTDETSILKQSSHMQTDALVEEVTNLKVRHLNNGSITIEKVLKKIDKDRYACVAYCLWWIMEFDNVRTTNSKSMVDYMKGLAGSHSVSGVKKSYFT
jgi:ribonucleoside-diphosphate reductase alpha chain